MRRRAIASHKSAVAPPKVRCAIYTRKSREEGLKQEFNSLDAQREAAEAYITSQKAEGWVCQPGRYDDGGFTGGTMDRPGLQRLLADIDAGKVDCVVVYKVDRLSRSIMDFAKIVETFEKHNVSFVSVTQHFNTTNSMGRLTLNILLSFAQFEREIIGERIRDKLAASRQRGKWTGGTPILGYDVDRSAGGPRLVINPTEASQVCQIFESYLELGALLPVVAELQRRGWRNKAWTTRAGRPRGGLPFDKCRLYNLLTNVLYIGQVRHKEHVYAGQHEPIVAAERFAQVQQQLQHNGRLANVEHRNRHGALLRGLLYCKACGRAMSHSFTTRGNRRYRYYACGSVTKRGRHACPSTALPAAEIEAAVVDQIRCIGQDPGLVAETLRQARGQVETTLGRLAAERGVVARGLARGQAELRRVVDHDGAKAASVARVAELNGQIGLAERRRAEIDAEVAAYGAEVVTKSDIQAALGDFGQVWAALRPKEQARVIHLLVQRVDYDAVAGTLDFTFYPSGIRTLADGHGTGGEEAA